MGVPYQGSDDTALEMLCTEYGLAAPGNINTRDAIDAAAAEAGVLAQLTVNGNDRDRIDELWDVLAAAVPVLEYVWDADASTMGVGFLDPAHSNGNRTVTVTVEEGLLTQKNYLAIMDGAFAGTSNVLDTTQAGAFTVALTLPPATSTYETSPQAYYIALAFMAEGVPVSLGAIVVNCNSDGTWEANVGETSTTPLTAPESIALEFDGIGTVTFKADGVTIATDSYTPGTHFVAMQMTVQAAVTSGGGSSIVATMTNTLPVVAP